MRTFAAVPLLALLAACATTAAPPAEPGAQPSPSPSQSSEADLEPIYAASMGRGGLTVRVGSNGCTKKEDFRTQVLDGWPAWTFILTRIKPDPCRAIIAGGVELTFSQKELGIGAGTALVLANPLTSDPTPGR